MKISPLSIPHSIEWTRTSTFHPSLKESQSEADEYPSDSQSNVPTTESVNQVKNIEVAELIFQVAIRLTAPYFNELVSQGRWAEFVRKVRTQHQGKKITYLLEGINNFINEQIRQTQRAFRNAVVNSSQDTLSVQANYIGKEQALHYIRNPNGRWIKLLFGFK